MVLEAPARFGRPPRVALLSIDPGRELATRGRVLDRLVRSSSRPERWTTSRFGREVELVRLHLGPIRSRTMLAASFGRESHHPGALPGGRTGRAERSLAASAVEVAYAIRWQELGDGIRRPSWLELLAEA
jgi:hypothetical protein